LLRCRTWRTLRSAHCAHRCAAILPRCSGVSEPACAGHIAPWAPLVARNKCPTHARAFWHRGEPSAPLSRSLRARGMSPLTVIEFNWASTWLPQPTDRKRTRVERQEAHCVAGAEVGRQTLWLPLAQGRNATIVRAQCLCLGATAQGQSLLRRSCGALPRRLLSASLPAALFLLAS
jgi:hypothetical protein